MAAPNTGAPATGNKDFGDKGLDAVERRAGQNPDKFRSVNEKITDKARQTVEKLTGKHVPAKVSN